MDQTIGDLPAPCSLALHGTTEPSPPTPLPPGEGSKALRFRLDLAVAGVQRNLWDKASSPWERGSSVVLLVYGAASDHREWSG